MAVPIKVPDLGTTVDEIKLLTWLVEEGESVERGDFLAEIETDKATGELESVAEGVLLKQLVAAGDTVEKGDVLAYVGEPGEAVPEAQDEPAHREDVPASSPPGRPSSDGPRVSPMVRNLAKKLGVDIGTTEGTGRNGTITRDDVLRTHKAAPAGAAPSGEGLSRSQSAVARAVLKSVREIPHLRVEAVVDMTAAERIREQSATSDSKISYDAILLKAMAAAIQTVPPVAARLDGDRVIHPEGIHIALAIGIENSLSLPVVRDVDRKDLPALQSEIADLASQAKTGALKPEQMTGGCMTLSNLGMYPIQSFDAIIFPEHSAILAVGAVQGGLVAVDERVETRPLATLKLAVDHRLINGRVAAEFLTRVKEAMESGNLK